jgi:hypothetical protein
MWSMRHRTRQAATSEFGANVLWIPGVCLSGICTYCRTHPHVRGRAALPDYSPLSLTQYDGSADLILSWEYRTRDQLLATGHRRFHLCPACHARIHKTRIVVSEMPALLLTLWRELHPSGHEQIRLNFQIHSPAVKAARLFEENGTWRDTPD